MTTIIRKCGSTFTPVYSLKLDEKKVESILTCSGSDEAIGRQFGVSQVMVSRIRRGKAWKHVYARVILGHEVIVREKRGARRFDDCYVPVTESGCWLWTGATDKQGYAVSGGNVRANRESYEINNGEIPDGLFVCHKCDVRICVNPEHLFLGSHKDNMNDMVLKGRQAKGVKNGNAKLDEEKVRQIIDSDLSCKKLAKKLGVCSATISHVRNGRIWRHITKLPSPERFK